MNGSRRHIANMNAKLIVALVIAINCYSSCGAALRRTPKVYNALITTDDNLTSSRAFPVIQPTIHETGIAHYPFGPYNPYGGFYGNQLLRFGQPIAPGLVPREQLPYPLPQSQFPPQIMRQPLHPQPQAYPFGYPVPPQAPPTAPGAELPPQPQTPPTGAATAPTAIAEQQPSPADQPQEQPPTGPQQQMPNEKLPIPLNEFGLPPALIPFRQYPHPRHGQVPPYGYNQYPQIYDPITGYREQYLQPFGYYPSHNFGVGPPQVGQPNAPPMLPPTAAPATAPPTASDVTEQTPPTAATEVDIELTTTEVPPPPNFDGIKNVSRSKNSAVPDVPPPPIPSGAKAKPSV